MCWGSNLRIGTTNQSSAAVASPGRTSLGRGSGDELNPRHGHPKRLNHVGNHVDLPGRALFSPQVFRSP
jgi:hypothetical protein